ncbi:HIT family protein [Paenibacillus filicis]|uniref:HIT family protein n=1 Tax=Paenibacillus filicis TaxID=669464 RepID=A0ABU9DFM1_9BACL
MNNDCLGCQLANGELPAQVVYEDERVACILDIAPIHEGHILILPKQHYLDVDDLDEATSAAIMKTSVILVRALKAAFHPDGITIMQNGGKFNDLGHYHMHVFPRYEADGFAWVEPEDVHNHKDRLQETGEKLRSILLK